MPRFQIKGRLRACQIPKWQIDLRAEPQGLNESRRTQQVSNLVSQELSFELVTEVAAFDALQDEWQRLWALSPTLSIFSSWTWSRLWWEHYSALGELSVIVIKRGKVVSAIAPLYRCKTRLLRLFPMETLRFIGTGGDTSPDDLDILIDPVESDQFVDALCEYLLDKVGSARLNCSDLSDDSKFARRLVCLAQHQGGYIRTVEPVVRRVQALPKTIEQHRSLLSRNSRKHLKRRARRLQDAGEARIEYCATHSEVDLALNALIELHKARHLSKGDGYSFDSQAYCGFHRQLMHALLDKGLLRLLCLYLDERVIGVEYAFMSRGALSFFQTGFDTEYKGLSPGHLMMAFMIDDAILNGVESIDLLKGNYEYKEHYASNFKYSWMIDYCKPGHMVSLIRRLERLRPNRSADPAMPPQFHTPGKGAVPRS